MSNITPTPPSFVFGYWRPWKENSNAFDSYLDYVKDKSLVKYGVDTVGKYISQASKEQVNAINELSRQIGYGIDILSDQITNVSQELAAINSTLGFIDSKLDMQIELQRYSNVLLENIIEIMKNPDSEKERKRAIELGFKFLSGAQNNSDLFHDALLELQKAEALMPQDPIVLRSIGFIFLYSEKHIDPEKAYTYFKKAIKYAQLDRDTNGNNSIEMSIRPNSTLSCRTELMKEWYRAQLKKDLPALIEKWVKIIGVKCNTWGVKLMKTKWGACTTQSKRIWLNLELAKKPPICLEYILCHELIHLIERTHNDRFIGLMNRHMPKWRRHKEVLNGLPLGHSNWEY